MRINEEVFKDLHFVYNHILTLAFWTVSMKINGEVIKMLHFVYNYILLTLVFWTF